jgi:hypothetical protein
MKKTAAAALACSLGLLVLAAPAGAAPGGKGHGKPANETASLTVDASTGTGAVTASGAFAGTGTVDTLKGKIAGRTHHFVVQLTFGQDTVTIKAQTHRVSRTLGANCAVTEQDKGVWQITKGTGAFATAKGVGRLVANANVTGTADASKPNGCDYSHLTGTITVDAKGRVKG